jgi:hypothetical protein
MQESEPNTVAYVLLPFLSLAYSLRLARSGLAVIRGAQVDFDSVAEKDWSSVLGPDHFPSSASNPSKLGAAAKKVVHEQPTSSPIRAAQKQKRLPSGTSPLPSVSTRQLAPQPHTSFSSSALPPPLQLPSASSSFSSSNLATLLSSFAPTHSFAASAPTLHAAGLSSLDTITCFIVGEASMVETVVEMLVRKGQLEENEGKWVVYAFEMARREWKSEKGP